MLLSNSYVKAGGAKQKKNAETQVKMLSYSTTPPNGFLLNFTS